MMVPITDAVIKVSLLTHLIECMDRGQLDALLGNGACPKAMDKLRHLDTSSLIRLANMNHPEILLTVDAKGIEFGLNELAREDRDRDDLVYFIEHGASLAMLNKLFTSVGSEVISGYRQRLTENRKFGRAVLPDESIRDAIHQAWHGISHAEVPATQRGKLRVLHGLFESFSMDTLYTTINEFQEPNPRRK
jgi:hypothetical protein